MKIPEIIKSITNKLNQKGFEAFLVGGCVRDLLLKKEPGDWDIATNAMPEEVKKIFPDSFYENDFLTVTVKTENKEESLKEIEITTYRSEAKYTDKRHPDIVKQAQTIEEDLSRRDFTINSMAMCLAENDLKYKIKKTSGKSFELQNEEISIIDPFKGKKDLDEKIIRAVGKPEERFQEDALRMMRAVRFASVLRFSIEGKTGRSIKDNSELISHISKERIRDEFVKIIVSDRPSEGIELLRELNLLKYIMPELEEGYKVGQNKHHIYDCWEHSLRALDYSAKKKFNKYVRIASLMHDIGKPRVKAGSGPDSTFYNHEIVGAKMTRDILERLKFPKKEIEKITKLVRYHLFYYNVGEVKEASVRRLVKNVGIENMEELLEVRQADRIGSGVPKAEPYKLRHLKYLIEKVSNDPISAKALKINGNDIIRELEIKAGPKIGWILEILLADILSNPKNNKKEMLIGKVKELGKLSDSDLAEKSKKAKSEIEEVEVKKDKMTKGKYWVV